MADRLEELHAIRKKGPNGELFGVKQLELLEAIFVHGYKHIYIDKGRKAGATEVAQYICARIASLTPLRNCYIIGPTQKDQADIVWQNRRIHQTIPMEWGAHFGSDHRVRLANESFIKVEGANDPEAVRSLQEGDIYVWDEAKDHNPMALDACYPNRATRDAVWIVMGTPATTKDNYFYRLKQQVKDDPNWYKIHMTAWDNPFLDGGHEYLKSMKEDYYKRGDWDLWEIEWEGKWVFNARHKVLPSFKELSHVRGLADLKSLVDKDAGGLRWVTVVDPGYSSVFAVLFAAYNPYTAQFFILDEIYSRHKEANSVLRMWPSIQAKQKSLYSGRWTTLYDNAALGFAVEVQAYLKERGERAVVVPTQKSPNDEDDYFRLINSCMAEEGRFYISDKCANTIKEIENYETDEHNRYPDEENHALDDLRYLFKFVGYSHALKKGKAAVVPKGERVDTYDPLREDLGRREDKSWGGFTDGFSVEEKIKGWMS